MNTHPTGEHPEMPFDERTREAYKQYVLGELQGMTAQLEVDTANILEEAQLLGGSEALQDILENIGVSQKNDGPEDSSALEYQRNEAQHRREALRIAKRMCGSAQKGRKMPFMEWCAMVKAMDGCTIEGKQKLIIYACKDPLREISRKLRKSASRNREEEKMCTVLIAATIAEFERELLS